MSSPYRLLSPRVVEVDFAPLRPLRPCPWCGANKVDDPQHYGATVRPCPGQSWWRRVFGGEMCSETRMHAHAACTHCKGTWIAGPQKS